MIQLNVESLNMKDVERAAVYEALRQCDFNREKTAAMLGCHRRSLYRRMVQLGLQKGPQPTAGRLANDNAIAEGAV